MYTLDLTKEELWYLREAILDHYNDYNDPGSSSCMEIAQEYSALLDIIDAVYIKCNEGAARKTR